MKINLKDFRVREGDEVNLRKWPTNVEPVYKSKQHYQKLLGEHITQLSALQELLYASNRYAVLLIFQAVLGLRWTPGSRQQTSLQPSDKCKGQGQGLYSLAAAYAGRPISPSFGDDCLGG